MKIARTKKIRAASKAGTAAMLFVIASCGGGGGGSEATGTPLPPSPPPPAAVAVAQVGVSPATIWLAPAQSTQLTPTLRDANNNVLTGRAITWTSSNTSIATVSPSGVVTTLAAGGPVTISAVSEGRTGNAQITVPARFGNSSLNVTYCSPNGIDQKLDLFYPTQSATALTPVIVYIHGGQLINGDKASGPNSPAGMWKPVAVNAGYTFVSINYRLGPTHRFPAIIEDAKCAIRHLRANAAQYGIDPNRIGVTGTSSGGYLSALIGLTDPSSGFEGNGGYAGVSSRVSAVVNEYGANMNLQLPPFGPAEVECRLLAYPQPPTASIIFGATVINHVTADDPPFLTVHGERDQAANPAASTALHAKLQSVGIPSSLQWVVNGGHGWSPAVSIYGAISPTWVQILAMELAFFDLHLKR